MGEFEDLIEQVRSGDESALDTLQEKFSGSNLRTQAEQGAEWQKKYQESLPLVRKAKLEDLTGKLDESLRDVGLSADDFADVDPGDLNLELIQDAAKNKLEQKNAQRLAAAQDAGFETVEEYNTALETVKQKRTERKEGMEAVASGVASGSGEPGEGESDSLLDRGSKAFKEAKEAGKTDDLALASSLEAIMGAQFVEGDSDE
jgi:hypothetical protein